jgi:type II secretory pathway component PulF
MFFSSQIPTKTLVGLCQRLSTGLLAGVAARTVWAREAQQARGYAARNAATTVSQAVNRGDSMADSLAATGEYFPTLFREMTAVGEQSGKLGEIYQQLGEHYYAQIVLRRIFLASIAWPVLQLTIAILVVGGLIWAMGYIGRMTHSTIDILGFGLVGDRGLEIYASIVGAAVVFILVCVRAAARGLVWIRPVQYFIAAVPVLGSSLRTLALSRLAWSMCQTMNAGMEVRRALRLSLRSTHSAIFTDQIEPIDAAIGRGTSITAAFSKTGRFPPDFMDVVEVGEQSGRLVESMGQLSRQYNEQARAALVALTAIAGFAVWALVAALLVTLIFRLWGFYFHSLDEVLPR